MVRVGRSFQDWQLTKSSIPERFKELLNLSQWTDCTFSVGAEGCAELIKCHKLVLAVSSPVFEAMFYGGLADCSQIINIPDIEPQPFRLFLRYIYSDSLDLNNIEDAGCLLYIGKKYMVPHLTKICLEYLKEHTYLQNLWDILSLAESLGEEALIEPCLKVMCRHHPKIWMSDEDHLSCYVFKKFIEQPSMVISELELWLFVNSWLEEECERRDLKVNILNRRKILYSCDILSKLRLYLLSDSELNTYVIESNLLTAEEIKQVFVLRNHYLKNQESSSTTRPRSKPFEVKLKSSREIIKRGNILYFNGPLVTKVICTGKILVGGFEVITKHASCLDSYHQQFSVSVKDSDGQVLNNTQYSPNGSLTFNSEHCVTLSHPVWFKPFREYYVTFNLNGNYQVCKCTETSMTKASLSTYFKYDDPSVEGTTNSLSSFSYITGILFFL